MAARRDKLVLSLFLMMVLGACLAAFLGSAAVVEKPEFTIVFSAGILRIVSVLGLVLFVTFYIRRSFDSKEIDYLLSRPVSRRAFVMSHVIAFALMGLVTAMVAGVALCIISYNDIGAGHVMWICSMAVELVIMANVAFFFAMVLSSASSSAMACVGFYALARIMGQILGILDEHIGLSDVAAVNYIMRLIGMVMPRFDLLGQTSWLVYGADASGAYGLMAIQLLTVTAVIGMATYLDLARRKF